MAAAPRCAFKPSSNSHCSSSMSSLEDDVETPVDAVEQPAPPKRKLSRLKKVRPVLKIAVRLCEFCTGR